MFLPTKLSLTNYCQIPKLTLDFSQGDIIAITAPNASGKSNSLFGLRFALTGMSSPGAKKMIEDIRDGQAFSKVDLDFSLGNNGYGKINRKIAKSGSELEVVIFDQNGTEVEKYVKSNQAEARFQEILGVSPKYISEVVISDQYSIASLLFWPASERSTKFQRFLHGTIFSDVEKLVQAERKRITVDPNAKQRLESIQMAIKEHEQNLAKAEASLRKFEQFLQKPSTRAALEKKKKKERQDELNTRREQLLKECRQLEADIESGKKDLKEPSKKELEFVEQSRIQIRDTRKQWLTYRPYLQAQKEITRIVQELETIQVELKKDEEKVSQTSKLQLRKGQLEIAKQAQTLQVTLKSTKEAKDNIQAELKKLLATQEELVKQEKQTTDIIEAKEPEYHLLTEALNHTNTHDRSSCVICNGTLTDAKHKEIVNRQKELDRIIQTAKSELVKVRETLQSTTKACTLKSRELEEATELMAEITEEINGLKDPLDWEDTFEEEHQQVSSKLAAMPLILENISKLEVRKGTLQADLAAQEAIPSCTKPTISEEELTSLESKFEMTEEVIKKFTEASNSLKELGGRLKSYQEVLGQHNQEYTKEGLEKPGDVIILTEAEEAIITQTEEYINWKQAEEKTKAAAEGSISALRTQEVKAKKDISGYEDSKNYISDLEQLESWVKYNGIPGTILKQQLNHLCNKMEHIIAAFDLRQHFRLEVNEALEVLMHYPTGITRSIQKASGGERMILGLAFRLATHQYLAPEMPMLIIDEPSNHLQDTNQVILQEIIRNLKCNLSQYGLKKLVYCTHLKPLAREADYVINLADQL